MSLDLLMEFLGWNAVINFGILICWAFFIRYAHDWTYRLHTRWLHISNERFDEIHYAGIAFYKLSIILFNLVPYLALRIIV